MLSDRTPRIATVDLSPFTSDATNGDAQADLNERRKAAAKALVHACHQRGFVKIVGHGLSREELHAAFAHSKALFDLPTEEKMKAPHPPGPMPHRGYSGLGVEKVYSKKEAADGDAGKDIRAVADFKESYEIGSEDDDQQPNIWLPDEAFPQFRSTSTALYERMVGVCRRILEVFSIGFGLDEAEHEAFMKLISGQYCQLRLLHYPEVSREKLENQSLARMPGHNDYSMFTILFQDDRGGLELQDPATGVFLPATPEEGALVLNIGDIFQRVTNDYFISAFHRVTVPQGESLNGAAAGAISARYSIPFFAAPAPTHVVATMPRFINEQKPLKYEPVAFQDYGALASRHQYKEN